MNVTLHGSFEHVLENSILVYNTINQPSNTKIQKLPINLISYKFLDLCPKNKNFHSLKKKKKYLLQKLATKKKSISKINQTLNFNIKKRERERNFANPVKKKIQKLTNLIDPPLGERIFPQSPSKATIFVFVCGLSPYIRRVDIIKSRCRSAHREIV